MLKYRFISGITLIALFSLTAFWESPAAAILFLALSVFILTAALIEYFGVVARLGHPGYRLLTITTGITMISTMGAVAIMGADIESSHRPLENLIILIFFISALLQAYNEDEYGQGVLNFAVTLGGYLYLVWSLGFMVKIYFFHSQCAQAGPMSFLFLVMVTKSADIGGYFLGKLMSKRSGGNKPLAPRLSPNKSWEGLIGSVAFSTTVAAGFAYWCGERLMIGENKDGSLLMIVAIGAALAVIGLVGDLSVSLLKRAADIKDSGRMIPGMGGILDVVDSLILASPFFYWFLIIN